MNVLLLSIVIVLFGMYSTIGKPANSRCRNNASLILYNCLFTFVSAIFSFCTSGKIFILPTSSIIISLVFGMMFCMTAYLHMKTIQTGPLSLGTLIISFSLIIPLIYSFLFLHEPFTLSKLIGILLLVVCVFLSTNLSSEDKKMSVKWFVFAILTLLSNGLQSALSQAHQVHTGGAYTSQFTALGYAFAALSSFFLFWIVKHKENAETRYFFNPAMLLLVFLSGLTSFGANYIVLSLAAVMNGSIVYPAVQGGSLVIVTLSSVLFLNERINLKKFITIVMGIVSVVLLNI